MFHIHINKLISLIKINIVYPDKDIDQELLECIFARACACVYICMKRKKTVKLKIEIKTEIIQANKTKKVIFFS